MPLEYNKQPVKAEISNVTASRAIDGTVYHNTTGRPLLCIVTVSLGCPAAGDTAFLDVGVKVSSPPNVSVARVGKTGGTAVIDQYCILSFMVPNEYYYRIVSNLGGGGSAGLTTWFEVEL